jgi:predicted aspartyl protease
MRFKTTNTPWRVPRARTSALSAALLLFTMLLAATGCEVRVEEGPVAAPPPVAQGAPTPAALEGEEQTVDLEVVSRAGSVLAAVPVFIDGQGPFIFILDTGASTSLVDEALVQRLNIPTGDTVGPVTGVTGETTATQIRLEQWSAGDVALPPTTGVTLPLPEPQEGLGPQGLLGSDVLSQFGAVTIDYENGLLTFRPRQ